MFTDTQHNSISCTILRIREDVRAGDIIAPTNTPPLLLPQHAQAGIFLAAYSRCSSGRASYWFNRVGRARIIAT